jgi:hypothetical protein
MVIPTLSVISLQLMLVDFCLEEQCCGEWRWLLELMTLVLVMDVRNGS